MNLTEVLAPETLYAMIREHSQFAHHGMTASCHIMGLIMAQPDLFPFAFLPVVINFA